MLLCSFSLVGLRSDADFMLWRIGHDLDASGCLLAYRAEAKVASPLLLLAEGFGHKRDAGTIVLPRLTHEELASMIASSRELVTHALANLRRRGVLGRERERVVILKSGELAEAGRRPSSPGNRSLPPRTQCGGEG
jgi:CRP-like cAMP-binding protein